MVRIADDWTSTLAKALAALNNRDLTVMVNWLSVPKPRPTRKADMIAAIETRLGGASLRRLWDELDEIQRLAVGEALHDAEGFEGKRFEAKYDAFPAGFDGIGAPGALPLRLFLHFRGGHVGSAPFIPPDLAERLRAFVPAPPEATLAGEDELPEAVDRRRRGYVPKGEEPTFDRVALVRRDMERAAQRDLVAALRLIDLGRVAVSAKTRRASAAATEAIAGELDGGDFFSPAEKPERWEQVVGPIRAHAWPWLVQAGKLAELRGSKLALTKKGHAALGAPAAETLRHLWQRWIRNDLLDEFSRVDAIKGQSRGKGKRALTAVSTRRPVVAEALEQCPLGRWVRFDEFSRFMQAASFDFGITRDPWKLYLFDSHYDSLGYDGCHGWDVLQGRYLLCVLFEYAATLGLIDVAYIHPKGARVDFTGLPGSDELAWLSRYDGLQYFRLNALGAYCLGLADTYEPGAFLERTSLTVFPDLRVCAGGALSADERLMLETFAEAEAEGVWRLARDRTLAAFESGHDGDGLRAFLAARDEQPLPERVEGFLRNVERGADALKARGTALLIECADEDTAARIAGDERLAKLCLRAGKKHLVVQTRAEAAFRKAVRDLGFGIRSA